MEIGVKDIFEGVPYLAVAIGGAILAQRYWTEGNVSKAHWKVVGIVVAIAGVLLFLWSFWDFQVPESQSPI